MTRHLLTSVALLLLAGCSVSFDPAGQPCDKQRHCLAGYTCDATDHCVKGGGSAGATGSGSGSTSGTTGTGSTTGGATTTGSSGSGTTTGASGCAATVCPAAQGCAMVNGVPTCQPRTAGTCDASSACTGAGEVCVSAGGGASLGLCVAGCTPGSGTCAQGTACTAVRGLRGNNFYACLPTPTPTACSNAAQCGAGLTCMVYDVSSVQGSADPLVNSLPLLFCDAPVTGGLGPGGSCTRSSECASGLCVQTSAGGLCEFPCVTSADCATGQSCGLVAVQGESRHAQACLAGAPTACSPCGSCGPDAPSCASQSNTCALPCNTTDIDPCGVSGSCVNAGTAAYCAVDGGPCP